MAKTGLDYRDGLIKLLRDMCIEEINNENGWSWGSDLTSDAKKEGRRKFANKVLHAIDVGDQMIQTLLQIEGEIR